MRKWRTICASNRRHRRRRSKVRGPAQFRELHFPGARSVSRIAQEAAFKVMEMSCSYSQFFHTLEFRHGPKAIVSPETCLTFFLSDSGQETEAEVLGEMKELGGTTMAVCNRATAAIQACADLTLEMTCGSELLAGAMSCRGSCSDFSPELRKASTPISRRISPESSFWTEE